MEILEERGEDYIQFVNTKSPKAKNPIFIVRSEHERRKKAAESMKYREIPLEGLTDYSMCINFSQYHWIRGVLKKRIEELGWEIDQFILVFTKDDYDGVFPKRLEEMIS